MPQKSVKPGKTNYEHQQNLKNHHCVIFVFEIIISKMSQAPLRYPAIVLLQEECIHAEVTFHCAHATDLKTVLGLASVSVW